MEKASNSNPAYHTHTHAHSQHSAYKVDSLSASQIHTNFQNFLDFFVFLYILVYTYT